MMKKYLITLAAVLCCGMTQAVFTSCNNDDDVTTDEGYVEGAFNYHISVANDNTDILLALDSLHSVIVEVKNAPTWLTVIPQDTLNSDGASAITLRVQESDDGAARKCRIYLTAESKEQVVLNVSQDEAVGNGDNAIEIDPEFLDHWEEMQFLNINNGGKMNTEIAAPWNEDLAETLMPEEICMDVKKKDGWEVAFSLLNQKGYTDMNYFGLYNKYSGVLRIFYYCNKNVTGSGSDFAFEVMLGGDKSNPAFYNTLRYGIPADAKVNANVDVLNSGLGKTFYLLTTPYSDMGQRTLSQGWHAFDIDMSAYTGKSFKTDGSDIKIACKTSSNASVSLGTDIMGKIYGNLSATIDRNSMMASADGVGGILSTIGNVLGNTSASSLASIEETICTGPLNSLNKYCVWTSAACNIAAHVYDFATGTENIPKDSLHGKLDLKLNATADTKGYMTAPTANDVKAFTLKKNAFNGASNFGKGVWQITTSPTIYVIDDMALWDEHAEHKHMIIMNSERSGYCYRTWWQNGNLQLPYFYDPTSFDVIINPELFPDATNVKVMSYCGIYANSTKANNHAFRQAIGISKPTNRYLFSPPNFVVGRAYWNEYLTAPAAGNGRKFKDYDLEKYAKLDWIHEVFGSQDKLTYTKVGKDSEVHFYGYLLTLDKSTLTDFMIEPHIFYPWTQNTGGANFYAEMREMPELYVIVILQFESGGKTYTYSRTYLPKFVNVGIQEACNGRVHHIMNEPYGVYGPSNKLKLHEYANSIGKKMLFCKGSITIP